MNNYKVTQAVPSECEYISIYKAVNQNKIITVAEFFKKVIDFSKIESDEGETLIQFYKRNADIHSTCYQTDLQPQQLSVVYEDFLYTLKDRLSQEGAPSQKRSMHCLYFLVDGLIHVLMQRQQSHLDLCPENIIFIDRENLRITGFGLKLGEPNTSILKGFRYRPYEYFDENAIPEKIDVWSLGIILYEMLYEEMPFEGETFEELQKSIEQKQYDSVEKFKGKYIDSKIKELLVGMLKFDQQERFSLNQVFEKTKEIIFNMEREQFRASLYKIGCIKTLQSQLQKNAKFQLTYGKKLIQQIHCSLEYKVREIKKDSQIQNNNDQIQQPLKMEKYLLLHAKEMDSQSLLVICQIVDILQYDILNKMTSIAEIEDYLEYPELGGYNQILDYVRNRILRVSA